MHIKPELRVIGVDDGPLVARQVLVVGAVMRGGAWLDGVVRAYVEKDGLDATQRISAMINGSKHAGQLRAIMLNGVTFGGFNVVDLAALREETGLPAIAVVRKPPDLERMRLALANLPDSGRRYETILRAGPLSVVQTEWRGGPVYYQCQGLGKEDAARLICETAVHSRIPEPLRVAHLIATGIVLGESSRRA